MELSNVAKPEVKDLLNNITECSSAWPELRVWDAEVESSNPSIPTN